MAKRSPILGYNHNVRHRGLLFHVQTEDSGVDNPHIYTHLFHSGVIISSRKLEYDRESAEEVVKALMQAQHKASLRELKAGALDPKITSYLGDHPDLRPAAGPPSFRDTIQGAPPVHDARAASAPAPPAAPPIQLVAEPGLPAEPSRTARSGDVSNAFRLIKRENTAPGEEPALPIEYAPPGQPPGARSRPPIQTGYAHYRTGRLERMPEVHDQPTAPIAARGVGRTPAVVSPAAPRPSAQTARPAGKPHAPIAPPLRPAGGPPGASRPPAPPAARPGVIVSRPAVIVGTPPRVVSPRERAPEPPVPRTVRRAREDTRPSLFGKDLISERSLDEVILAYLSEDAEK